MEIITASREQLSKQEIYNLTKNPEIQKLSLAAGSQLELADYLIYDKVDSSGEISRIFACKTRDGELMATNSKTFIAEITDLIDIFGTDLHVIKVIQGRSKSGRTYITCSYVS